MTMLRTKFILHVCSIRLLEGITFYITFSGNSIVDLFDYKKRKYAYLLGEKNFLQAPLQVVSSFLLKLQEGRNSLEFRNTFE